MNLYNKFIAGCLKNNTEAADDHVSHASNVALPCFYGNGTAQRLFNPLPASWLETTRSDLAHLSPALECEGSTLERSDPFSPVINDTDFCFDWPGAFPGYSPMLPLPSQPSLKQRGSMPEFPGETCTSLNNSKASWIWWACEMVNFLSVTVRSYCM